MPTVSVVTCTYNRAHLIGETIQSVLAQTFQDFEYIIIDDGSSDSTEEVVSAFRDSRIKYSKHERTGGHLSKLRNLAHTHCAGDYIAYIDSDDLWHPKKLELQIGGLKAHPSTQFSFTDILIFDKDGVIKSSIYSRSGSFVGSAFPQMLVNKLIICHTTLLLHRNCITKIGPMDETMHSGDHDFVFMLSRMFDAYVIYEPLVHVRKHDQNSTGSHQLSLKLLTEHHLTLGKLFSRDLISQKEYDKAMAITNYSFGTQVLAAKDYKTAIRYFFACIKITPWNLKAWIRLAITSAKKIFGS
jgi:glycosyltransferase involved in cell wall biosynthesis